MAILGKQNVTVTLKGLNQKSPGTIGAPGTLEIAENVRIEKGEQGNFEIVRRNGLTEIADTTAGTGFRMVSYGNALVAETLSGMERLTTGGTAFTAASTLPVTPLSVKRNDIQMPFDQAAGLSSPAQAWLDVAYIGDIACYVFADQTGGMAYVVRDSVTLSVLASGTIATADKTRVVALGTSFYLFRKFGAGVSAISGVKILSTAPYTVSGTTTVIAAGSCFTGTGFDVQAGFDSTHIALIYRSAAGTYVRALVDTSFAVTTSTTDAVAADQPDVAMCWIPQDTFGGSLYYCTLNAANGLKMQTIDKATLAITATTSDATALFTGIVAGIGTLTGAVNMTGFIQSGTPYALIDFTYTDSTLAVRVGTALHSGARTYISVAAQLVSRAFYIRSIPHFVMLYASKKTGTGQPINSQPTFFVERYDATTGASAIVAKLLQANACERTPDGGPSSVAVDSSGAMHFLAQKIRAQQVALGGAVAFYNGITDLAVVPASSTMASPLSFGGVSLWPGGRLLELDNAPIGPLHEQGIDLHPENPTLAEGAAASGSIQPGTHSIVMRWKWLDSSGQSYVTAVSAPVSITTVNANSSIQVTAHAPGAMTWPARRYVLVQIFRTPINGTGDEYFLVSNTTTYVVDTYTSSLFTFVDAQDESTLIAGEPFIPSEAAGGELENVSPPALNDIVEHKGHIFGISAEEPWKVFMSKAYTPGTSLGFTEGFFMTVSQATPLYKIMSMDGHLVGFARDAVYVWSGDFPDNTGAGEFPTAVQLPVGVGTEQPRSVVLTDMGIMFYSSKRGFWLLNRSLGVDYVGAAVEQTAAGQTVSGAAVHPTYLEVRFTTEGGTTFVLNTYFTRLAGTPVWTTFTGQACIHSIVHQGDWYLLTSAGKLLKEDLTRWRDGVALGGGAFTAGAAFKAKVQISDINFAGIGGLARVWRGQLLGQWYDSHQVKVTLTLNHRSAAGQVFTYDAAVDPDPYELEFRLNAIESKQTSMSVTIEDTTGFQTRGFAWTALMFSVGVKSGLFRGSRGRMMVGD